MYVLPVFLNVCTNKYYTYNFLLNSAEGVSGVPPSPPSLEKIKREIDLHS